MTSPSVEQIPAGINAVEGYKASMNGDGLRIRELLPGIIKRGAEALTPAEKELLKWVGVFFRKPTPGKFMMRIRMPNGFAGSEQLRTIAELSRRLGNSVLDITTRQQIELRGFTLDTVPEIFQKLRDVDLRTLQTGIDNVRNINGCALAGLTPHELFDASPVVRELDRIIVGNEGNLEFTNLPRKFNIVVTGCTDNCTHSESQDIALVPAKKAGRLGFNVLVGGKMGSGGFTVASPLNVFVEIFQAAAAVVELIKIYRDHGPREARSKCRFAFLIEEWGVRRLRAELVARLGHELAFQGRDMRGSKHSDHLGVSTQKQSGLVAVGLCIPTGRVNPDQLDELARLADTYGNGGIRFTTAQNAIIPNVAAARVAKLLEEPLLGQLSPRPSPFVRGLVACVGTDYCNLALIETKSRAIALSEALHNKMGAGVNPLTIHWSGCPAGCGNHQAADIGLRGFKTRIDGRIVDAVAIYTGGRTGPHAIAGQEILETVPCDESLPDVVANVIQSYRFDMEAREHPALSDPLFTAAATAGLASWRFARVLPPAPVLA
ncbi:MAG TPA: ferredoxin--nitrite reductase [Candidatus Polarisedimenticolia bacterium]|nr:ferredoxin--nitrite reductase [Candidatus Polarisedimenticolia bacterium]